MRPLPIRPYHRRKTIYFEGKWYTPLQYWQIKGFRILAVIFILTYIFVMLFPHVYVEAKGFEDILIPEAILFVSPEPSTHPTPSPLSGPVTSTPTPTQVATPTPTPTTKPTATPTPKFIPTSEIEKTIVSIFGVHAEKGIKMLKTCENSKLDPTIINKANRNGTWDVGLWQINVKPSNVEEVERLKDPVYNTKIAWQKFTAHNMKFYLWTCGHVVGDYTYVHALNAKNK